MTRLDDKLVPKALSLINDLGKSAEFIRDGLAIYDAATGSGAVAGPTSFPRNISPPEPYDTRLVDGDVVQAGDTKCLVAASGLAFVIKKGMRVKIDNDTWQIIGCNSVYSGTSIAAYELQLRR